MKTIVAAIDFSDVSEKVLAQTSELAKATGARVDLVHGVEQVASFYDIYGYTVPDMTDLAKTLSEKAAHTLEEKAKKLGLAEDQVKTHILEGSFLDTLNDFVKEQNADLLVIGSHGHGIVARVLLGSTAQRLLHKMEVPTLVVPA